MSQGLGNVDNGPGLIIFCDPEYDTSEDAWFKI